VADAGLGRLSGCIGQLIAVARYWQDQGELPSGAVEAMEFELAWLLKESDARRRPRMPRDRAMRVAKRLGAFTMFAGAQTLMATPMGNSATLAVDELPSDAEPVEPSRGIDPADYREVLDTALFDTGPSGSVIFRHQRYMEYLAAAYLVEREVHTGQIPALLGVHANGRLPIARVGVAAWLAALKPTLINKLIADNALMFASSAAVTELPSDEARAAVVAGVLAAAVHEDASPDWTVTRSALVHSGLSDQLATHLSVGPRSSEQLWWIARLAETGGCASLAQALACAASDPMWDAYARRAAVDAVGAVGDDEIRGSLGELLRVPVSAQDIDPDNEVRAAVIDMLYPRLLSTADLTLALRPHLSLLHGGYRQTLRELPDRIPEGDLATFATWLASHTEHADRFGCEDQFGELYLGIVRVAWHGADDETLRRALARLVVSGVQSGQWLRYPARRDGVPWWEGPIERRRALAIEVARTETWHAAVILALLTGDDIEWLLDILPTVATSVVDGLTNCLPALLHTPTARLADRILGLPPTHPAFETTQYLRGSIDAQSGQIQAQRTMSMQDHQFQQQRVDHQVRVKAELVTVLDRLDANPESWWRIPWLLGNDLTHTVDHVTGHDITRRPGWAYLDTAQQQLVLARGIHYLRVHQPSPATRSAQTPWSFDTVLPDWSGVHLLTTLLQHDPDRLTALTPTTWERWAPWIVATPVFGTDEARDLRTQLIDAAPPATRRHLINAALAHLDDLDANGLSLTPDVIYTHLATDLVSPIADRLVTTPAENALTRDLLTFLVHHAPPTIALNTCRQLIDGQGPLAGHARTHLAKLDPNSVIDALAAASDPHGPEELANAIQGLQVTGLDHAHLITAATLLLDTHPYAADPPLTSGFTFTARHHARDLRRQTLEQLASGGHFDDLTALQHGRPEPDRQALSHYLQIAKARQADLSVAPTRPKALLNLLRRGDARLVRDDADLQHVLLQHLQDVQRHLTDTTAFQEIWKSDQPQSEDDISDWLQRRFHERLSGGLIIDREVQVNRPRGRGIGTRIDLTATTKTPTDHTARVIIEAKRVDNSKLMTAMHQQLIDRYLIPQQRHYGIYLVYWITPDQRPPTWSPTTAADPDTLTQQLHEQANQAHHEGMRIQPYVLNISRPA
jgi:hypothetical protein